MTKAPLILATFGGVAGLLLSYPHLNNPIVPSPGSSGVDFGIEILNQAVLPAILGSILALVGGTLSIIRERAGGFTLVVAAIVGAMGWLSSLGQVILGFKVNLFLLFLVIGVGFVWWDSLILLGGLIAVRRTRNILKRIWESSALPQPREATTAPESR